MSACPRCKAAASPTTIRHLDGCPYIRALQLDLGYKGPFLRDGVLHVADGQRASNREEP